LLDLLQWLNEYGDIGVLLYEDLLLLLGYDELLLTFDEVKYCGDFSFKVFIPRMNALFN
jgi:hypothetical protein